MNRGAYGSYRKSTIRRRKTGFRKRNPVGQFSYKRRPVGSAFRTASNSVKCTYTSVVGQQPSSPDYSWGNSTYINLFQLLLGSTEFVSRRTQYSYYKINGMKISFTRRWITPIQLGLDQVRGGWLSLEHGLGPLNVNFYPNLSGVPVGLPVAYADSSFVVSPHITGTQVHNLRFPRDMTTGINSQGLGVWNPTVNANTISGELAFYNDPAVQALPSDFSPIAIWDFEVELMISFCNNTGV